MGETNTIQRIISQTISRVVPEKYPYIQRPAVQYARITASTGKYNLKVLDQHGEPDAGYPEIPEVESKQDLEVGEKVVILWVNGTDVYIAGKATQ